MKNWLNFVLDISQYCTNIQLSAEKPSNYLLRLKKQSLNDSFYRGILCANMLDSQKSDEGDADKVV